MTEEPSEFPRGRHRLAEFLKDLDEHLDFGPILVEIRCKYYSSQFFLCRTRADFEQAIQDVNELEEIWVSECDEIEPQCRLLEDDL